MYMSGGPCYNNNSIKEISPWLSTQICLPNILFSCLCYQEDCRDATRSFAREAILLTQTFFMFRMVTNWSEWSTYAALLALMWNRMTTINDGAQGQPWGWSTGCFFCQGRGNIVPRKFGMSQRKSHWQSTQND
jgi:hypothetical protein